VYSFGPAYGFFGDIVHCTITTIPCISDRVLVFPFVSLFTIVFFSIWHNIPFTLGIWARVFFAGWSHVLYDLLKQIPSLQASD
jgi:hypothetical protein